MIYHHCLLPSSPPTTPTLDFSPASPCANICRVVKAWKVNSAECLRCNSKDKSRSGSVGQGSRVQRRVHCLWPSPLSSYSYFQIPAFSLIVQGCFFWLWPHKDREVEGCFCGGIHVSLSLYKCYLFLGLKTAYRQHRGDVKAEGSWFVKPVAHFPQRMWQRTLNFPAYL